MLLGRYEVVERIPAWKNVLDLSEVVPNESWMLVGGLMTQVHAGLAGFSSRATDDLDVLVDVLARGSNVATVIRGLEQLGFTPQEPGLRGGAFHRMAKGMMIADVLVADHLPSSRQKSTRLGVWPILEIPGGAQAIERRAFVEIKSDLRSATIAIPNLLGALVLKCAAYASDKREKQRHLEDIAVLASLIEDHASVLDQLHGSDRKRLRRAAAELENTNHPAWVQLSGDQRRKGQDTMRILAS